MIRRKSWIDQANEATTISEVLMSLGIYVPEGSYYGNSKKIHCPFGFYHSDGGIDKAMRIYYKSNTAYCFSCNKRYSPVTLFSAKNDCSLTNAALELLDSKGLGFKSLEEQWEEANKKPEVILDVSALADALKIYCSTLVDNWTILQLNDVVSSKLNACFNLLDLVKTDEDAHNWLSTCKAAMKRLLETL
jgi:hypothetical protein